MYLLTALLIFYAVAAAVFEGYCRVTGKKWPKDVNIIFLFLACFYAVHFIGYGKILSAGLPLTASQAYVFPVVMIFLGIGSLCALFLAIAFFTAFLLLGNKDGARFCLLFWGWLFLAFIPVPPFFPNFLTYFAFKALLR